MRFGPPIPGAPWAAPLAGRGPGALGGGSPTPAAATGGTNLPHVETDPEAPRRTRAHLNLVAQILNSLIRQGQLVLTTPGEWAVATAVVSQAITTGTQTTIPGLLFGAAGAIQGLSLGSNLSITGGVLNAAGGGGGGSIYTAPVLADFTFVNQGAATATVPATSGGIWLTKPTQGGSSNVTQLVRNIPGATWTMVWGYRPACGPGTGTSGGIGPSLYDSGTGKIVFLVYGGHHASVAGGTPLIVVNFLNATTGSSVPFGPVAVGEHRGGGGGYFHKIVNDGAFLRFSYGPDLDVWVEYYTQAVGSFLAVDKVGFCVDAFDETAGAALFHFQLSSP